MADFTTAFLWTMQYEDPDHACTLVGDDVGTVISGINSAVWPDAVDVIAALPREQRWGAVQEFYEAHYWNAWLSQLESDEVAKRVFDAGVNQGQGTAVEILQKAILQCDPDANLDVDGIFGPHTLMRANSETEANLVTAFCAQRVDQYRATVSTNPALAPYLDAWLARAQR
jgi:lysozyme family protein